MTNEPPAPPIVTTAGGKAAEVTAVIHEDALNEQKSVPPTTTVEQDKTTLGQRKVNLIWEGTQSAIAVMVTGSVIYCAITGKESLLLGNAFTLIVALYYVRTNHTKIGGVGPTEMHR